MNSKNVPRTENLVSIITPIYNSQQWITQTVRSVQAQSHQDWELICVYDDGNSDDGIGLLENFKKTDPRIQIFKSSMRGVAAARNLGIQQSTGRWLAFLDADDLWLPNKLQTQIQFMKDSNSQFCCTAWRKIDEQGVVFGSIQIPPTSIDYRQLLANNSIGCLTVMIDLDRLPHPLFVEHPLEDFIAWLSVLRPGGVCHGIPQVLSEYRVVSNSRSQRYFRLTARWRVLRRFEGIGLLLSTFYFVSYLFFALKKRAV